MEPRQNANMPDIKLTARNALRILSIVCALLTFLPAFRISVMGQSFKFSAMKIAVGSEFYGVELDPSPLWALTLLIPIGIIVVLTLKAIERKKESIIALAASGLDFLLWIILHAGMKDKAEGAFSEVDRLLAYGFSIFLLLIMIAASLLVFLGKVQMDTDLIEFFSDGDVAKKAINQVSSAVGKASDRVSKLAGEISANTAPKNNAPMNNAPAERKCAVCGAVLKPGNQFCTSCGTPASQAPEEEYYDEGPAFCPTCGKKITPGADFCTGCGTRLR